MEILANKMRPNSLKEIIGQEHLVGEGKILTNLVKQKHLCSMILYGHPGTGKTSLANAIVKELNLKARFLNATINKKEDFDIAIEEAKMYGDLILVVDEIHRMNKDKQDLLLPHIESGLIILIGLTTSNPYHKINPAIRSRVQIFELKDLTTRDIIKGLTRACDSLENIKIDTDSLKFIAEAANGDVRSAMNLLETAYYASETKEITKDFLKTIHTKPVFIHDKNEDGHYDLLSAFQKSIRGSDIDASLHYLGRLIEAGDLDSIYRRMSVIAYEDIGLANPAIGPKVMAAIEAAERIGLPEARIPLGTIITEMALSPKSNSAHIALDAALNDIKKGNIGPIPNHIKSNSTNYLYPHNYQNAYIKQEYLPVNLKGKKYFQPKNNKYETSLYNAWKERTGEKNEY